MFRHNVGNPVKDVLDRSLVEYTDLSVSMNMPVADGKSVKVSNRFQIAKTTRPLLSLSKICERGDLDVLCREDEAFILDKNHNVVSRFEKRNGLYVAAIDVDNHPWAPG